MGDPYLVSMTDHGFSEDLGDPSNRIFMLIDVSKKELKDLAYLEFSDSEYFSQTRSIWENYAKWSYSIPFFIGTDTPEESAIYVGFLFKETTPCFFAKLKEDCEMYKLARESFDNHWGQHGDSVERRG